MKVIPETCRAVRYTFLYIMKSDGHQFHQYQQNKQFICVIFMFQQVDGYTALVSPQVETSLPG
jgi:hypothetical protein